MTLKEHYVEIPETRLEIPIRKSDLLAILASATGEKAKHAHETVLGMEEGEITRIIEKAVLFVSEPNNVDQFHLGGNFLAEDGTERKRRIVTLGVEDPSAQNNFLDYLCLKIVRTDAKVAHEVTLLQQIQQAIRSTKTNDLRIPTVLGVKMLAGQKQVGIIMERLPRDRHNASIQTLVSEAKTEGMVCRLSDDVASDVERAFSTLHRLGFLHRDINEGNVYLRNIQYRDVVLPKQPGKPRPKTRLILAADVVLLDFEKTFAMPTRQPRANLNESREEDRQVRSMLEANSLPLGSDCNDEDLVEANDGYFSAHA